MRMPWDERIGELELGREKRSNAGPGIAECRERARGSAELHRQLCFYKHGPRIRDRHQPACSFVSERRRHRLLEQRSRRHRSRAVLASEPRTPVRHACELAVDELARVSGNDHHRTVEDVLARRAVMHDRRRDMRRKGFCT